MDFIPKPIADYSEDHTTPESPLLQKINRDTHAYILKPRMLSGHLQGRFLSMVSHLLRPTSILEIGTYTGYSAICLAEGLAPGGKLITLEKNPELETRLLDYFNKAGLSQTIELHIGNAVTMLPTLSGPFDLVFIDADKENNATYFDLIIDKVRPGGLVMVDNVLWSGKVVESKSDKDTKAILDFNAKVHNDPRVENLLLPIRDGIMMIRKL